ncbi:glycosyltransferase family 2 protein [Vibrio japonicus]|uniref:Glycosyltransferase family 2 protein n=1 Tax=Vibrio japonicus TaxID=1824638 RepID=A0ABY5LGE9_9VIBR|nr:glycosyltransferase family 2 protein [Vibrio japonicus]UUM30021.1 glycosyltransferase family 2 protein [Vibrio japonicus]
METRVKLVAIAKDEAAYLPEWIYHHAYFGFDSFDIHVNNTSDKSKEVLEKLSNAYNINIIDSDGLYHKGAKLFQTRAYEYSLKKTPSKQFSHIAFFDVDEFWTPNDFKSSIQEYIKKSEQFDVYLFNWAIHKSDSDFSHCFSKNNVLALDLHVKHLIKLGRKYSLGIHNSNGDNLHYADGNLKTADFLEHVKAKVKIDKGCFPKAFLVHRLYRGQLEYVSMLGRGLPNGNRFKSNRKGYKTDKGLDIEYKIDSYLLDNYYQKYETMLENLDLVSDVFDSKGYVTARYQKLLSVIDNGVNKDEAKVLYRALNNITIPEVVRRRRQIKDELNKEPAQLGLHLTKNDLRHPHKTVSLNGSRNKYIDEIRNASLFFEESDPDIACQLMRIAHKLRPEGEFIKHKLTQMEQKITDD